MRVRDRTTEWTLAHVSELIILPVTAMCAATSWGLMLWMAFIPERLIGAVIGLALLSATTITVGMLVKSLRLPFTLHIASLVLLVALSISGLRMGFAWPPLVLFLTWGASLWLSLVLAVVPPVHSAPTDDSEAASRLEELKLEWEVYFRRHSRWIQRAGWVRAVVLLASALAAWLISTGLGIHGTGSSEPPYGPVASVLLCSLVLFAGLLNLVGRKRLWESEGALHVDPGFSSRWPAVLAATVLFTAATALVLPANISPLYAIDWQSVMNSVTVWLFGRNKYNVSRSGTVVQDWMAGPTAIESSMPGGGLELLPMVYAMMAIFILGWGAWKAFQLFRDTEAGRWRGLGALLKYVFRLPFLLLGLLFDAILGMFRGQGRRGSAMGRRVDRARRRTSVTGGPTSSVQAATIRRLFVLVLIWAREQGSPRSPYQTVTEFAAGLTRRFPTVAEDIAYVARVYQDVRYSPVETGQTALQQVRTCYDRIVASTRKSKNKPARA